MSFKFWASQVCCLAARLGGSFVFAVVDSELVHQSEDFAADFLDGAETVYFIVFPAVAVVADKRFCLFVIGGYPVGNSLIVGIVGAAFDGCPVADALFYGLVRNHQGDSGCNLFSGLASLQRFRPVRGSLHR